MGSEGKRRYLRREEEGPGVHGQGYLWMQMKCRLGPGRADKGEGWVGLPREVDELG